MKAVMKRSVLKSDMIAKIAFVVDDGVVDLNLNETALVGYVITLQKWVIKLII